MLKNTKQPIYSLDVKGMWIIFVLLWSAAWAHKCCPTCACAARCQAPAIRATLNATGLTVYCPNAECACVTDELDTCTYGKVWTNQTEFGWKDARWHKCIKIESLDPLSARGMIRWWHNKCIGHVQLKLDLAVTKVTRDLFVDFNVLAYFEHDTIHNVYTIRTQSGSDDDRPMAGHSEMFFEAVLTEHATGVHVAITNCTVQIIEGKSVHARVINEINVFDPNHLHSIENGMRMTYTAFWDDETHSPFQRLVCKYALYNGTAPISDGAANRTYMMADPNERGVLINGADDVITNGL